MYRDNTLIPTEALRLAALGSLAEGDKRYGALASEIRQFVGRIAGPSLDLLGPSLELLCYEGLAETSDGEGMEDDALLAVTEEGRRVFAQLMTSNVRTPVNDMGKLVIALKMRFLHLLPAAGQRDQAAILAETCAGELARLEDLRRSYGEGHLGAWLELDISQLKDRLAWFRALGERL